MNKKNKVFGLLIVFIFFISVLGLAILFNPFKKRNNQSNCDEKISNSSKFPSLTSSPKAKSLKTDEKFINNTADFSLDLFKKLATNKENVLISPTSIMLALSMTANGADNNTLKEMESLLGKDIPLQDLNAYLKYYVDNLKTTEKSKLSIANSIWFRNEEERLSIENSFLQTNADFYKASIFEAPFDQSTVDDINNWVYYNTDQMIKEMIKEIDYDSVMFLINAIVFDGEWSRIYNESDIYKDNFKDIKDKSDSFDFMKSEESTYIEDSMASGFIKDYANNDYSFLAVLPNEDVSLADYIGTLTGQSFLNLINKSQSTTVYAAMPKFSYDYEISLIESLKSMGLLEGFDSFKADFSKLGKSSRGNIFIGEVLHKTYISVDEKGTKAGAASSVEMKDESAPMEPKFVTLNRPFLYAIIDKSTNLPVFIGSVNELK